MIHSQHIYAYNWRLSDHVFFLLATEIKNLQLERERKKIDKKEENITINTGSDCFSKIF